MILCQQWKENERRSRDLNASCESLSEDGGGVDYCPRPGWEAEYYPDYDSTEPEQRWGSGSVGYWHDMKVDGSIEF